MHQILEPIHVEEAEHSPESKNGKKLSALCLSRRAILLLAYLVIASSLTAEGDQTLK